MRLIDADALIKNLQEMADLEWNQQVGSSKGIEDAIDVIENFPAVEDRPTGKWELVGFDGCKCSLCQNLLPHSDEYEYETDYCPYCGAKMEAENE